MSSRSKIEERIKRKEAEVVELDGKIREARAYIQAMQDVLKMLPRDEDTPADTILREGSGVAKARDAILEAGRPLHISKILAALGREMNNKNRANLSGSISAYVRRDEIFTRPAPNTFGLVEQGDTENAESQEQIDDELPDGFGEPSPPDLPDEVPF